MRLANSFNEVRDSINHIRNLRKGFITNFFPDERKVSVWIDKRLLWMEEYGSSTLFVKQDNDFSNVLFCSTSKDELQKALTQLDNKDGSVIELLTDRRTPEGLMESLEEAGYQPYKCLIRMSKMNDGAWEDKGGVSENATPDDIVQIDSLLHKYFDKRAEQLPTREELHEMVDGKRIILRKIDNEVAGLLVYDLSPSTLHLRFWLVVPKYRGLGIGSDLFHIFSRRGNTARRHLLWVMEDNNQAKKRYEHYGYKADDVRDHVLLYEPNK